MQVSRQEVRDFIERGDMIPDTLVSGALGRPLARTSH